MNTIENEIVKFWFEDGILFSAFKKPMHMGLEETKKIIELRHLISNKESQYWVMDMRNLKSVPNEVHTYIDINGQRFVHASAVIVDSFLVKFLVEVFIRVKKPYVPMKIFQSQAGAVEWLREMKEKQKNIVSNV